MKDLGAKALVYKSADISDADLLIRIYNSAFYEDVFRVGRCQAEGLAGGGMGV